MRAISRVKRIQRCVLIFSFLSTRGAICSLLGRNVPRFLLALSSFEQSVFIQALCMPSPLASLALLLQFHSRAANDSNRSSSKSRPVKTPPGKCNGWLFHRRRVHQLRCLLAARTHTYIQPSRACLCLFLPPACNRPRNPRSRKRAADLSGWRNRSGGVRLSSYLTLKALHLVSMVAWFAGLFYIFRLFVYRINHESAEACALFA